MPLTTDTPWAMERFLPLSLRHAIGKIPPEMLEEAEHTLRRKLQAKVGKNEMKLFEMLKVRFWDLYRAAASDPKKNKCEISIAMWLSEFCTKEWYNKHMLNNPVAMAFVVCPPPQEFTRMKVTINRAIERLSEVFELPLMYTDAKGNEKVNSALIGQMHSITKTLLERVHGGVMQKAQIHTHTTSDGKNRPASIALPDTQRLGDIASQLAELQKRLDIEETKPVSLEGEIIEEGG